MLASALALVLVVSSAAPSPNRVMLMPLVAGEGVTETTADAVTDAVAGELRRVPGLQVITRKEVTAVLSLERQKSLMGCTSDSCIAELGGALDVERLVTGNVAKLGESWILHLQLVDAKKVATLSNADRRKRGGVIDDVLDAIPSMVKELFSGQPSAPAAEVVQAPLPPPAPAKKGVAPRTADVPQEAEQLKKPLSLVTDGKGHYLAFTPGDTDAPVYSGDGRSFYALPVVGYGSDSNGFEYNFWDPRVNSPAEAEFSLQKSEYKLRCAKQHYSFKPVPEAQSKELLKKARLLKGRWHRQGIALARDDEGTYFYVDMPRDADSLTEPQLYIGEMGSLVPVDTRIVSNDEDVVILGTPEGKLKYSHRNKEAEWIQNGTRRKLAYLLLLDHRKQIYTTLGVYKGEQLGLACDQAF